MLAIVTWVPIIAWAWWKQRLIGMGTAEPMLTHYGITVRCLVAIPLMIVAAAMVQLIMPRIIPYFLSSGVMPPTEAGPFREVLAGVARLRDRTLPWAFILGITLAVSAGSPALTGTHELDWARGAGETGVGFGGKWFLYVVRPIFLAVLLGWLWRLCLFAMLLRRISRLKFSLVPSQPDGNGGLGSPP